MPEEVAVAPSPAAPARPTPPESSDEPWVDEAVAVENMVERTVDPSLEMVVTDPLEPVGELSLSDVREDDGEMVAVRPSESVVEKTSSERVNVSTSPLEKVAKNKALKSMELESVVWEDVREVAEARSIVTSEMKTELPLVRVEAGTVSETPMMVKCLATYQMWSN